MRKRVRVGLVLGVAVFTSIGASFSQSATAREPECLTAAGKTACGYNCVGSDGMVRCSQTQAGVCSTSSGVVACWDPPSVLYRVIGPLLPKPTCVSALGGQTACGYNCETHSDRVQCAQTPFGVCEARDGRIVCWDPPAPVMLTRRLKTPAPECVYSGSNIACGYSCMNFAGTLRCAQTPEGTCRVEQGELVCWDPPLDSFPVTYDPATERACMDGYQGRSCGYRCLATARFSACGTSNDDSCRSEPDGIVCKRPGSTP